MRHPRLLVLALLGSLLAIPSGATAQSSDSDDIQVLARVIQVLDVRAVRDLDFGTVLGGTTVEVPTASPAAGKFEVIAQPGQEVRFQLTQLPSELTRVGGAETIPLTLEGAVGQEDDPSSATGANLTAGPVDEVFPVSGRLFLWIGGTITPVQDQVVGDYLGVIELTAAYTGS